MIARAEESTHIQFNVRKQEKKYHGDEMQYTTDLEPTRLRQYAWDRDKRTNNGAKQRDDQINQQATEVNVVITTWKELQSQDRNINR